MAFFLMAGTYLRHLLQNPQGPFGYIGWQEIIPLNQAIILIKLLFKVIASKPL